MKFDCIIINPPYQHGLHLKILNEVTKQAVSQCTRPNSPTKNVKGW